MDSREETMRHLGNVLSILAELHPDDSCRALDNAMIYYNKCNPDLQIEPVMGITRLVHEMKGID